jgi:hypothetical protein
MKRNSLLLLVIALLAACGPVKTTTDKDLAKLPSPCDPITEVDTMISTGELQDPKLQSEAYKNRPAFIVYFPDSASRCQPIGQDSGE